MSSQIVDIDRPSGSEIMNVKISLEKLAKNLSTENLAFLAELSARPNINKKLESNKNLIKMSL